MATQGPRTSLLVIGLGSAGVVVLTGLLACIGGPHSPGGAFFSVIYVLLIAGLPAVAYLAAGIGLGQLFAPLTRDAGDAGPINAALGIATMLWLTSAGGSIWLDTSFVGRAIAFVPVIVGVALLIRHVMRTHTTLNLGVLAALPPTALLLAAALNPPGWLWSSEFGGYDALSYHLQLPQEWMASGRILPLEHNVYSFLPGYVEGAFTHVAILSGVTPPYGETGAPAGLLTGEGMATISAQLLHAGLAVVAAWLVGRAARGTAQRFGWSEGTAATAEFVSALFFLATPWVIVTGSLAYNEMGVTCLLAGAVLVTLQEDTAPWKRGLICGWLIGMACGAKPTAFFLAGVPLAAMLFGQMRARDWAWCAGAGCIAGLVALSPWLVRNTLLASNPVFPYATSVFGEAHWTAEQVARFRHHHAFDGSIAERLALMVLPDANDPAGARHRGLMHAQWFAFFPLAVAGGVILLARGVRDRAAWLLAAMFLIQLVAWMFLTHVQSRFLLPLAVTGAMLVGLGSARAMARRCSMTGKIGLALAIVCVAMQFGMSIAIFARQQGGRPNARLTVAPNMLTGDGLDEQQAQAGALTTMNRLLPSGTRVYLLGDAAPFYATIDVIYNTTWDPWPLGEAVRAAPDDPAAWTRHLRDMGAAFVMVDEVGLRLFWRSGTADPDITPDVVDAWLQHESTRPVQSWQGEGKHLFRLEPR